jgi:glycosyltransferase involved in cell wall biosynthesis
LEPGYDLIHSYNAVPLFPRVPYIVTFEDYFPRVPEDRYIGWLHRFLAREAAGARCLGLIAESQYAFRQFEYQNRRFPWSQALLKKTQIILPAIPARASRPKTMGDQLRLIFVGSDFMRKGLPILLRSHSALRAEGIPVSTTVVSALQWRTDDYIGPPDPGIVQETRHLLNQDGIHVLGVEKPVPNDEVLQLMQQADFLVLPTFHDTFGYVSIEALSVGTPVIATSTCALPEVVDDGINGHLLPFDNDEAIGKWRWLYRNREPGYNQAYSDEIARLSDELTKVLLRCWEGRTAYEAMSEAALEKVRRAFNPDHARQQIEEMYEKVRI